MDQRSFLGALFYSVRPSACFGVALFSVAGLGKWDNWPLVLLTFFSAFIGACGCFLINDIFDREKDLKNNKKRPIATGEISVKTASITAILCCLAIIATSIYLGVNTLIMAIVLTFGFWVYPYINQHFGLFSNIWVSLCSASAFLYGASINKFTSIVCLAAISTFFINISREILLDVLDKTGDKAVGKPSIPLKFGDNGTKMIVALFYMFGSAAFIVYNYKSSSFLPWMIVLLALLWIPFFLKTKGEFRKWALFNVRTSHLVFIAIIIALFFFGNEAKSQITKRDCINKLEHLQSKTDGFHPKGIFPDSFYWLSKKNGKDDNGVFATAWIAYILRSMDERNADTTNNSMLNLALCSFENYRNRNGEPSYNFWQTVGSDLPFPKSKFFSKSKYRLPDDFDDTALIQLARGPHVMDDSVRVKMLAYIAKSELTNIKGISSELKKNKVYEVWYGNKMKELDLVVMANVLHFVKKKRYKPDSIDNNTSSYIKNCINEGLYLNDLKNYAPYYGRPALVLYSLSRLVADDSTNEFLEQKDKLIKQLFDAYLKSENSIDKIMLSTSLLRLGQPISLELSQKKIDKDIKSFMYTFRQPSIIKLKILPSFKWSSEALSWALLYEMLSFNPQINWKS